MYLIDKKIKNSKRKIAILAYKHPSNGHYVAIKYDIKSKKFEIYNYKNEHDKAYSVCSIDSWLKEDASGTPLCLITIL